MFSTVPAEFNIFNPSLRMFFAAFKSRSKTCPFLHVHSLIERYKDVIDKITIGCLTGTYQELINIQKHCQILLKNNEKNNNTVTDSNNQYNG